VERTELCACHSSASACRVDRPSEWTQQSSTALNAVVLVSSDFLSPAPSIPRGLAGPWLYNIMKTPAANRFISAKYNPIHCEPQRGDGHVQKLLRVLRWGELHCSPEPCDASEAGPTFLLPLFLLSLSYILPFPIFLLHFLRLLSSLSVYHF
jgi:hypothetical protein